MNAAIPRRSAPAGVILLGIVVLLGMLAAGCGEAAPEDASEEEGSTIATEAPSTPPTSAATTEVPTTTEAPATSASTTEAPTTASTTTTLPPRRIEVCELFDSATAEDVGIDLDPVPTVETVEASRSQEDADALAPMRMDAVHNCGLSFAAGVVVWDAQSPTDAAASLDVSLQSASWDGRLPLVPVPTSVSDRGSTVVDVELDNSTVQWQSDDLHVVINVSGFSEAGLSPDEARDLLIDLATYAQGQL